MISTAGATTGARFANAGKPAPVVNGRKQKRKRIKAIQCLKVRHSAGARMRQANLMASRDPIMHPRRTIIPHRRSDAQPFTRTASHLVRPTTSGTKSRCQLLDFQYLDHRRRDAARNFESDDIVLEHLLSQQGQPLPRAI
jgi:hypothetical protein